MLKNRFDIFEIEYNDKDKDYIDDLIEHIKDNYIEVMQFFKLDNISSIVKIKIWNDIEEYRNFFNNMYLSYGIQKTVPTWEIQRSSKDDTPRIDAISFYLIKDVKGHFNDSLENYFKGFIHEFVHTCHEEYSGGYSFLTWFKESLAILLSHQYENQSIKLEASLDDIINGKADYRNYYVIGKYVMDKYGKDFLLELASDNNLVMKLTPKLYMEAKSIK